MRAIDHDQILHEDGIVWLEDPHHFDYVRQSLAWTGTRRRRPPKSANPAGPLGRIIGYATLRPDAPSDHPGVFFRRVFWVKQHDRSEDPGGVYRVGAPVEAVDLHTLAPRSPGEMTARALGGAH